MEKRTIPASASHQNHAARNGDLIPLPVKTSPSAVPKPADAPASGRLREDNPVGEWALKISQALGSQASGVVQAGVLLISAKAALQHGQWLELFKKGRLGMRERKAQKLMRIAQNGFFANPSNWTDLPVSLAVLYELSALDAVTLERGAKNGLVGANTSMLKARRFLSDNGIQQKKANPAFDQMARVAKLRRFVCRECELWPRDLREQLAVELDKLAVEASESQIQAEKFTGRNQ